MQIVQSLPPISLSGNLQDLILATTATEVLTVKLMVGDKIIVDEVYRPDSNGQVKIRYKYIINKILRLYIPDFATSVFNQSSACIDFIILLNSSTGQTDQVNFKVIKGQIDSDELNTNIFLQGNFLTWQPQAKYIQYYDPQWLTYFAAEDCYLQVAAYCAPSKLTIIKTLANLPANQLCSINLSHGLIQELFSVDGIPVYYDVYIEKEGVRMSYVQRYILSQEEFEFNDVFVFENSIGGLDTIRFTGEATHKPDFEFDNAWFDEMNFDYEVRPDYVIEKNTGYFRTEEEKIWSADFFSSLQKYKVQNGSLLQIYSLDPNLSSVKGELAAYSFNYSFSKKDDAMNLCRTFEAPPALELPDDIIETSLALAPRINHYPWATTKDVLFPVQYPYEDKWRKLSLKQVIASIILGNSTNDDDDDDSAAGLIANFFGDWTDLSAKNPLIVTEDLPLRFKTDNKTSPTQIITYLAGQFFIDSSFEGTEIILGTLPDGNRPELKLIKYFITANIDMFLTIDSNGEVKIISKDGKKLPVGTEDANKYFVNIFYKPGQGEQTRYTPKWVIDPTASYCEPNQSIYVWGRIFEEERQKTGFFGTLYFAKFFLRTYKGTADAPPLNLNEPYACSNPSIKLTYTHPQGGNFTAIMNNVEQIQLYPPNNVGDGSGRAPVKNGNSEYHCAFLGQGKDTWKLLQINNANGNTGNQINPRLMKVSDDVNEYPLDDNNDVCVITGLPQAKVANPQDAANYKVLNLNSCPI